jgi:NAD(P)H-quinone oxidoreductase subunit 5
VIGVVLFALWYRLFASLIPTTEVVSTGLRIRLGLAAIAFTGLFIVQSVILHRPHGAVARRLYPHFLAGFYLDEFITFLTFRVWPPRKSSTVAVTAPSVASPVLQEQMA